MEIEKIAKKFSNIVLIINDSHFGAIPSYNIGLQLVESEFVYFAAADDTINPELFQRSIDCLTRDLDAAFVSGKANLFFLGSNKTGMRPLVSPRVRNKYMSQKEVAEEFRTNDNWILTGSCVFRVNKLREAGSFPSYLESSADSIVARKLAFNHGCVFIDYVGVNWRINELGLSRSANFDFERLLKLHSNINQYLKDNNFPSWYRDKYIKRFKFGVLRLNIFGNESNYNIVQMYSPLIGLILFKKFGKILIIKLFLIILIAFKFRPFSFRRLLYSKIRFFASKLGHYFFPTPTANK